MGIKWREMSIPWEDLKTFSGTLNSHLQYVYLVYALFTVILTATITPGYQTPDEHSHFLRAEQISRGVFVGKFISLMPTKEHRTSPDGRIVYPDSGGYYGNQGILLSQYAYHELNFNPDRKVTTAMINNSRKYYWKKDLVLFHFPNTVIYPPTGYIFPTIGVLVGKWMHMTVYDTSILARIINGIGCVIICFFAMGLARRCRLMLFFLLLLPLTISLFASVSQDGMLISAATLLVGLIDHVESGEKRKYTTAQILLLIICISIISAAKPPYFLLILIFLFLSLTPRMKLYCITIPFLIVLTWGLLNLNNYSVSWASPEMQINTKLQMAYVLHHPFTFIGLYFHWDFYAILIKMYEFIGILGWLDLVLPGFYYKLAYFLLFLVFLSIVQFDSEKLRLRMIILFAVFISFLAIMAAQYITWTALESPYLGGIQSRYFIPVIPFLALGIAGFRKEQAMKNWQVAVFILVVIFPLITQFIMIQKFILRYYLT
jgi:uncharacterized membrane protein